MTQDQLVTQPLSVSPLRDDRGVCKECAAGTHPTWVDYPTWWMTLPGGGPYLVDDPTWWTTLPGG